MAAITDMVARYDGTIAYRDNSVGYFHAQYTDGHNFSVDASGSHVAEDNCKWYWDGHAWRFWGIQNALWAGLAMIGAGGDLDTVQIALPKTVSDVVFHISMLFTFDDGQTYPVSATYDSKGGYYYNDTPNMFTAASNEAAWRLKIAQMLAQILNVVILPKGA